VSEQASECERESAAPFCLKAFSSVPGNRSSSGGGGGVITFSVSLNTFDGFFYSFDINILKI